MIETKKISPLVDKKIAMIARENSFSTLIRGEDKIEEILNSCASFVNKEDILGYINLDSPAPVRGHLIFTERVLYYTCISKIGKREKRFVIPYYYLKRVFQKKKVLIVEMTWGEKIKIKNSNLGIKALRDFLQKASSAAQKELGMLETELKKNVGKLFSESNCSFEQSYINKKISFSGKERPLALISTPKGDYLFTDSSFYFPGSKGIIRIVGNEIKRVEQEKSEVIIETSKEQHIINEKGMDSAKLVDILYAYQKLPLPGKQTEYKPVKRDNILKISWPVVGLVLMLFLLKDFWLPILNLLMGVSLFDLIPQHGPLLEVFSPFSDSDPLAKMAYFPGLGTLLILMVMLWVFFKRGDRKALIGRRFEGREILTAFWPPLFLTFFGWGLETIIYEWVPAIWWGAGSQFWFSVGFISVQPFSFLVFSLIIVLVLLPLLGEMLFRGIILHRIRLRKTILFAVAYSSLLNSLFWGYFSAVYGLPPGHPLFYFLLGMVLGLLFLKTQSFYLSFLAHSFYLCFALIRYLSDFPSLIWGSVMFLVGMIGLFLFFVTFRPGPGDEFPYFRIYPEKLK